MHPKLVSNQHKIAGGGETNLDHGIAEETRDIASTTILSEESEHTHGDNEELSIPLTGNGTAEFPSRVEVAPSETKAPVHNTLIEKCEYSENDRRLVQNRNTTMELSPKPSPQELDVWYGRQFRTLNFDELDLWEYIMPFLNATTVAKAPATPFHSGFRNQMMMVTSFYI